MIQSYYRYKIQKTYEKLDTNIKETRKHKDYSHLCGHYAELYNEKMYEKIIVIELLFCSKQEIYLTTKVEPL